MNIEDLTKPVCTRCFERGHDVADCKEDRQNFAVIGPIAAFIGARLQYPCPMINGQGNPWVSTIKVDQHKEKFWKVRVYCDLADPDLVQKKWTWLKDRQKRIDAGEKFYWRMHREAYKMLVDGGDEAPPEFFARCVLHDSIHYREVYMDMVQLRPHLRDRICSEADHSILLHEKVEEVHVPDERLEFICKKFHVKDRDELMTFLKKVYNPSFKDMAELRD